MLIRYNNVPQLQKVDPFEGEDDYERLSFTATGLVSGKNRLETVPDPAEMLRAASVLVCVIQRGESENDIR